MFIFDCDDTLLLTETPASIVLCQYLNDVGIPINLDDCLDRFRGIEIRQMLLLISNEYHVKFSEKWIAELEKAQTDVVRRDARACPGAFDVLNALTARNLLWCVASNSSRSEMTDKFTAAGLYDLVAGRLFSAVDYSSYKPLPDVYLAAAASVNLAPTNCIVIEDSETGLRAGRAAGMLNVYYNPRRSKRVSKTLYDHQIFHLRECLDISDRRLILGAYN